MSLLNLDKAEVMIRNSSIFLNAEKKPQIYFLVGIQCFDYVSK